MVDVPTAGGPTAIAANRRSVMQGWTPPLVGRCCRPGESLLHVGTRLGFLLCLDASFFLLIGPWPRLLRIWWPLSCKGSSLARRGCWIAERVPSLRGRKCWWPLGAQLGRCMWNMMLVAPVPVPSSGTSSSRCLRLVPSPGPTPHLSQGQPEHSGCHNTFGYNTHALYKQGQ
jgi:hypothetical protein